MTPVVQGQGWGLLQGEALSCLRPETPAVCEIPGTRAVADVAEATAECGALQVRNWSWQEVTCLVEGVQTESGDSGRGLSLIHI